MHGAHGVHGTDMNDATKHYCKIQQLGIETTDVERTNDKSYPSGVNTAMNVEIN